MSDLAPLAEAVAVDPLVGHPADYHVFHKFLERCKNLPAITTAVVWPQSDVALKGTWKLPAPALLSRRSSATNLKSRPLPRKWGSTSAPTPSFRRTRKEGRRTRRGHVPQRQCPGHDEG